MLFKEDEIARAEATAVRENAAWYRWTHDLVKVTGEDAEKFLDWILVNSIAGLSVGRGKYTTMLDENGGIIDDLVVFHKAEGLWWLSTLYGPHAVKWFDAHSQGFNVAYEDITQEIDMYAIQGPNSAKVMDGLIADSVDDLKRFQIIDQREFRAALDPELQNTCILAGRTVELDRQFLIAEHGIVDDLRHSFGLLLPQFGKLGNYIIRQLFPRESDKLGNHVGHSFDLFFMCHNNSSNFI